MEQTRYYRFEQSDIVVRVSGTVVEKRGADNVWKRAPELLYKFASGDVNLIEISEAGAKDSFFVPFTKENFPETNGEIAISSETYRNFKN